VADQPEQGAMVVKMVVKNRRRSLPLCSPVVLVSPVAERDGVREPRHTRGDLRAASSNAGFGHITSHVLRKTRATMLGHAGLSARAIAAQLGHANPSLTQDVYLGRKVASTGAAAALEALRPTAPYHDQEDSRV